MLSTDILKSPEVARVMKELINYGCSLGLPDPQISLQFQTDGATIVCATCYDPDREERIVYGKVIPLPPSPELFARYLLAPAKNYLQVLEGRLSTKH